MPTVRFIGPRTQDVSEGAGFLEHQLQLSAPSSQPVTVTIGGASYREGDMQVAPQTVTFQPGQVTATFHAAVYEDSTYEGDEVFSYTITSATNATIDQGSDGSVISNREFLGHIIDNDAPPGSATADGGAVFNAAMASETLSGGNGNDTITAISGSNYLRGNDGGDAISGGTGFDDINGNQGNDTAHGNAGDDWVVGGKDHDLLFGDAGGDVVWGNLGNDTVDGGDGNDQVRGGQGDDSVSGGGGNDFVSGDRGNDTISGGSGADLFHGSQDAGIDKVLDFHLSEGDRVMLDPGTVYTIAQEGADTVIHMGVGNEMILVGVQLSTLTPGWIFEG